MKVNRYIEAFKENHNLVGLATFAAASAALLSPIPLLVGVVAEIAYLLFYADSRWYELRLAQRFDAEVAARRATLKQQVFPILDATLQARFVRLETMRGEIGEQAKDDEQWYREVLRKLDFLLEKFLHFSAKQAQFRKYLQEVRDEARREARGFPAAKPANAAATQSQKTNPTLLRPVRGTQNHAPSFASEAMDRWIEQTVNEIQQAYDVELKDLQARAQAESDDVTRAVLEKRLEVLRRRREFVGKIARIQINLNHQLQLVEDTFGLINDEIRARPPEQVLSDIEDVVTQTNSMTQLLDDFAPLERMLSK